MGDSQYDWLIFLCLGEHQWLSTNCHPPRPYLLLKCKFSFPLHAAQTVAPGTCCHSWSQSPLPARQPHHRAAQTVAPGTTSCPCLLTHRLAPTIKSERDPVTFLFRYPSIGVFSSTRFHSMAIILFLIFLGIFKEIKCYIYFLGITPSPVCSPSPPHHHRGPAIEGKRGYRNFAKRQYKPKCTVGPLWWLTRLLICKNMICVSRFIQTHKQSCTPTRG